jgi:hypothetical protein
MYENGGCDRGRNERKERFGRKREGRENDLEAAWSYLQIEKREVKKRDRNYRMLSSG